MIRVWTDFVVYVTLVTRRSIRPPRVLTPSIVCSRKPIVLGGWVSYKKVKHPKTTKTKMLARNYTLILKKVTTTYSDRRFRAGLTTGRETQILCAKMKEKLSAVTVVSCIHAITSRHNTAAFYTRWAEHEDRPRATDLHHVVRPWGGDRTEGLLSVPERCEDAQTLGGWRQHGNFVARTSRRF